MYLNIFECLFPQHQRNETIWYNCVGVAETNIECTIPPKTMNHPCCSSSENSTRCKGCETPRTAVHEAPRTWQDRSSQMDAGILMVGGQLLHARRRETID